MRAMDVAAQNGILADSLKPRLSLLHEKGRLGQISGTISYLDLVTFYLIYGCVTAAYVIMGGLFAAAFTDVMQGFMIIFLSTILIPVGLMEAWWVYRTSRQSFGRHVPFVWQWRGK